MRKPAFVLTLSLAAALGACQKTGEGEYQVKTPDVDVNVSADTATVRTPSVDVTTQPETVITNVPKVDVETPAERKAEAKTP